MLQELKGVRTENQASWLPGFIIVLTATYGTCPFLKQPLRVTCWTFNPQTPMFIALGYGSFGGCLGLDDVLRAGPPDRSRGLYKNRKRIWDGMPALLATQCCDAARGSGRGQHFIRGLPTIENCELNSPPCVINWPRIFYHSSHKQICPLANPT